MQSTILITILASLFLVKHIKATEIPEFVQHIIYDSKERLLCFHLKGLAKRLFMLLFESVHMLEVQTGNIQQIYRESNNFFTGIKILIIEKVNDHFP